MKKIFLLNYLLVLFLAGCNPALYATTATKTTAETNITNSTPTPFTTVLDPNFSFSPNETMYPTPWTRPSPLPTITPEPDQTVLDASRYCRESVDALENLHDQYNGDPYHFYLNRYFEIFQDLKLEEGYKLDYFIDIDMPFIYTTPGVRPFQQMVDNEHPFENIYKTLFPLEPQYNTFLSYPRDVNSHKYLDHIIVNDTPEGFYQFLILALYGDTFYLLDHAVYSDAIALCDQTDLKRVVKGMDAFKLTLPDDITAQMKNLDFSPSISMGEKTITIRMLQFTKWGGFYESIFTINREFPHRLLRVDNNTLISFHCNIMF